MTSRSTCGLIVNSTRSASATASRFDATVRTPRRASSARRRLSRGWLATTLEAATIAFASRPAMIDSAITPAPMKASRVSPNTESPTLSAFSFAFCRLAIHSLRGGPSSQRPQPLPSQLRSLASRQTLLVDQLELHRPRRLGLDAEHVRARLEHGGAAHGFLPGRSEREIASLVAAITRNGDGKLPRRLDRESVDPGAFDRLDDLLVPGGGNGGSERARSTLDGGRA